MLKIKINMKKKDYLTNVYTLIGKNMQMDYEFKAMAETIKKMYGYDKKTATYWSLEMFNKYGIKSLKDYNACIDDKCKWLIDELLDLMNEYYKMDEIIYLISKNVKLYEVRFCIWRHLFGNNGDNRFKMYFDELISKKKYEEAAELVRDVLKNQGYIPYEIFDATEFLNNIINYYTYSKDRIKNQQLLNMLYSFVELIPDEVSKAVLMSNFIDYLSD